VKEEALTTTVQAVVVVTAVVETVVVAVATAVVETVAVAAEEEDTKNFSLYDTKNHSRK
jgi:hypothetical protein